MSIEVGAKAPSQMQGKASATPAHQVDDDSVWGAHAPGAYVRLLLALTRTTPLGRGSSRTKLRGLIEQQHPGPLDCLLYGQKIRAYLAEGNRCEWKAVLNPGLFDPLERRLVGQILARDKAVFLDIGANIGVHSLSAISHVRKDARIIAFEPHPLTFRRLQFNLAQTGFSGATALEVALGDSEASVNLSDDDLSLASVQGNGLGPSVRMRRLSDCLAELGIDHVDAIKIDVEGFEDAALYEYISQAADAMLPELIIMEHAGRHVWKRDILQDIIARGFIIAKVHGNNTFLVKPGSRAAAILDQ